MNICRICEKNRNLINLQITKNNAIIDMLTTIANIEYSNDDKLPKRVCRNCYYNIKRSFRFKNQIEQTDCKLRSHLLDKLNLKKITANKYDIISGYDCFNASDIKFQNEIVADQVGLPHEDFSFKLEVVSSSCDEVDDVTNRFKEDANIKVETFANDTSAATKDPLVTAVDKKVVKIKNLGNYECFICKRPYKLWKRLRRHFREFHDGQTEFINKLQCTLCSKVFTQGMNLRRHIAVVHHNLKTFKCEICCTAFSRKATLDLHALTRHSEERPFKCDTCSRAYHTAKLLELHQKVHSGKLTQRPKQKVKKLNFTCEICGKILIGKLSYTLHVGTHSDERPYKCNWCTQAFKRQTLLQVHLRIHTGELPYECAICSRKFRQACQLKRHQLTHTGERPHKCTHCDKTFAQKGNLMAHIRLHTGETPYHCVGCPMQFHDINGLKRHRKIHAELVPS